MRTGFAFSTTAFDTEMVYKRSAGYYVQRVMAKGIERRKICHE